MHTSSGGKVFLDQGIPGIGGLNSFSITSVTTKLKCFVYKNITKLNILGSLIAEKLAFCIDMVNHSL
jgi:hypothetical protein